MNSTKKFFLIMFLSLMGIVAMIDYFYSKKKYKTTQEELYVLMSEEFSNNKIEKIICRQYPGMGDYSLFKVENKNTYYPILLDFNVEQEIWNSFKRGNILTKKKGQLAVEISDGQRTIHTYFRHPKNEYDYTGVYMSFIFSALASIIIFKIPESSFGKLLNGD